MFVMLASFGSLWDPPGALRLVDIQAIGRENRTHADSIEHHFVAAS
jgi:hypothetical protein